MLHFDRPDYLWLLSSLPLLFFFLSRFLSTGRSVQQILGRAARRSLLSLESRDWLSATLVVVGLISVVLALAGPYLEQIVEKPEYQKMNLVFLLDVSPSMNTRDVWPSRLDRSKEVIREFVQRDTGISRFGLVSFSESSIILSYLTSDLQNLFFYLDFLRPDRNLILGTDIGAALLSGVEVFEKQVQAKGEGDLARQKRVLVLLSDGEDHGETLEEALKSVREHGIRVHTIGVGTSQGGVMPVINELGQREYLRDEYGRPLVSKLSVDTLQRIAHDAGGRLFRASSGPELDFALQSILQTERQVIGYRVGLLKRELARYFVGLGFFSQLLIMTLRL